MAVEIFAAGRRSPRGSGSLNQMRRRAGKSKKRAFFAGHPSQAITHN